jgi:Asp-tRNA(Asn)/Glu-tRNA(Gln) amidotransferase A subunit family amidase
MLREVCDLTIKEAAAAIASGELTASQLVESCLKRIDTFEKKIQAWALLDRQGASETAKQLDKELKQGKLRGPLHGIPLGIKDMIYTAGLRTEAGSSTWKGFIPQYDATSVAKLKNAGAIILGKTQTTQFACFDPAPTANPWDLNHTPGGSSSGSGAGVAAGMCLAALGTQTLGSVLRPAAFNGIVGFKPTYGRISTYGVVPFAWTLDHVGILARSVEDSAYVFQAIAGYDSLDSHSLDEEVPDCLSGVEKSDAPKLGIVRQYFFSKADEEMRFHTESVVQLLQQAGAGLQEVKLPSGFAEIESNGRIIMAVEAAAFHQEMFAKSKNQYRPGIRGEVEQGLSVSATDFAKRLQIRLQQWTELKPLFNEVDAFLTPGAPGPAPEGLNATGSPVMQAPWTILGVPSISLPTGLSQHGLPLAIQLVGRHNAEKQLLAVARWCERALNFNIKPSLIYS